jgi:hypothetical protein
VASSTRREARAVAQRVSENHLLQSNIPRRPDIVANHHQLDLERTSGYLQCDCLGPPREVGH